MGRKQHNAKKAYKPKPPFSTIEGLKSRAYEELSVSSGWILNEFYRKFNGFNRFNLSLTRRDVKGKMSNATLSKSIFELIAYGFLDVKRPGRLERQCTIYGFSNRWRKLSDDELMLKSIVIGLKRLERVKRIKAEKKRKRLIYHKIRIQILGKHWKSILCLPKT